MDSAFQPASKKIRAFIALAIPPQWESEIAMIQKALKKAVRGADMKWVEPANIHLTLRFLGYIAPAEVPSIVERLKTATAQRNSFNVSAAPLGCFPNCRRPRVVWIGLDAEDAISELHAVVAKATHNFGEPPENRPFKAHLTLARVKHLSKENARSLETQIAKTEVSLPEWRADELVFFQSHLSQAGARYEALGRFPFAS